MATNSAPIVTAKIKTMTCNSITITMTCDPSASQWSWRYFDYSTRQWSQWFYDNNGGISRTITINKLKNNGQYNIQISAKSSQTNVWGYATEFVAIELRDLPTIIVQNPVIQDGRRYIILGETYSLHCNSVLSSDRFSIYAIVGSWSEKIYTKNTEGTEVNFNYSLPLSVANEIVNNNFSTVEFKLVTDFDIENSLLFSIQVPDNESTKPQINFLNFSVNELDSPFGQYFVKGYTTLKAEVNGGGKFGAEIDSFIMEYDNYSVVKKATSGVNVLVGNTVLKEEDSVISITIVDKRGYKRKYSGLLSSETTDLSNTFFSMKENINLFNMIGVNYNVNGCFGNDSDPSLSLLNKFDFSTVSTSGGAQYCLYFNTGEPVFIRGATWSSEGTWSSNMSGLHKIVTITNGNDVTNTGLIGWLQDNATAGIKIYDYYDPVGTITSEITHITPAETIEGVTTDPLMNITTTYSWDYAFIANGHNVECQRWKQVNGEWVLDDSHLIITIPFHSTGSEEWIQEDLDYTGNYYWKITLEDALHGPNKTYKSVEYTSRLALSPIAISRLNGGGGVTFFGEAQETGLWVVENGTYKNVTVGNARSFYGTCNTIGSEAVKEVSCEQFGVTDLVNGTTIKVKFNERNSANHSNLFLNVNNTGAFSIVYPNGNLCLLENIKTFVYYENVVEDVTERKWICIDTELINKSLSKVFNVDEYYEIEDPDPNANPSGLGWYEYVDYDYVLTEDTVVNTEKTYYEIQKMSLDSLSNYIISNTFFINTNWLEQNDPLLTTIGPNVEGILFNLQSSSNLVKDTYQIFMSINPTTIYSRFHNYSGGGGQSFSGWENWSRSNIQVDQTRRVLIFGDSYFRPNPIGGGNSVGSYLSGYLANTNILYAINSQGGEGFAVETPGYNFLDDIDTFVPPFNNREVTDIIFAGGYNDRNFSISNIENGIDICFNACRSKYPNAKLHIGHFGWHAGLHSEQRFKCIANSIPAYRSASKHGASYMVNSEYTMHYYDLFVAPSVDYIHPNSDGCREIAKQVALYLNTGTCDVHYPYKRLYFNYTGSDYPFISPPGGWTNTSYSIGSALDNDKVRIYMPDGTTYYATGSDNFELPVGSYTALLALTTTTDVGYRLHFIGMYDGTDSQGNPKPGAAIGQGHLLPNIPVKGLIGKSGDYNSVSQLECVLSAGSLWARNYSVKSDYSNYKTITGIKWLELGGGMFTIPTLEC